MKKTVATHTVPTHYAAVRLQLFEYSIRSFVFNFS